MRMSVAIPVAKILERFGHNNQWPNCWKISNPLKFLPVDKYMTRGAVNLAAISLTMKQIEMEGYVTG